MHLETVPPITEIIGTFMRKLLATQGAVGPILATTDELMTLMRNIYLWLTATEAAKINLPNELEWGE